FTLTRAHAQPVYLVRLKCAGIGLIPAFARNPERRARPSVADTLEAQAAIGDGVLNARNVLVEYLRIPRLGIEIRAVTVAGPLVFVPALHERSALFKLDEVTVHSRLRQPVDHVEDVLDGA